MKHNIIRSLLALTACLSVHAFAEQAWITDDLRTGVQDGPKRNAGFAGTLIAGTPVERLETSADGEYVHIRTGDIDGWVLARNLTNTPSLRARFGEQAQALQTANQQLSELQSTDETASAQIQRLRDALQAAQAEAQKARDELLSLKRASENVVEIDALNRELQDKVVNLEQSNLRLTQQNTRLSDQTNHRQMIIGGVLVLSGMLLCWLLSILSGARRRSTFNDF